MRQSKRRRLSAEAMRAVLARFAQSGLSVATFCQAEAISASSFYRWRSLLGGTAGREVTTRDASITSRGSAAEFVDLGALPPPRERMELRLDLGGGVLLHWVRG